MTIRHLIPIGIFALLIIFFGIGLTLDPRKIPSPLIGKSIPSFKLPTLRDPKKSFSHQDMKGHVSVLNVWASWCYECRVEHPQLTALAKKNIVPIYGLNYKDKRVDALKWLQDFGDPFTVNAFDLKGRVAIDWGVYGVPETFIIDQNGIIRHKHIGAIMPDALDKTIIPIIMELKNKRQD